MWQSCLLLGEMKAWHTVRVTVWFSSTAQHADIGRVDCASSCSMLAVTRDDTYYVQVPFQCRNCPASPAVTPSTGLLPPSPDASNPPGSITLKISGLSPALNPLQPSQPHSQKATHTLLCMQPVNRLPHPFPAQGIHCDPLSHAGLHASLSLLPRTHTTGHLSPSPDANITHDQHLQPRPHLPAAPSPTPSNTHCRSHAVFIPPLSRLPPPSLFAEPTP
jgi:hypothetical protein